MLRKTSVSSWKSRGIFLIALAVVAFMVASSGASHAANKPDLAGKAQADTPIAAQPEATCPPDGQCFADVLSSNPFYAFINRIYQQDLVSGYACGGAGEPCDASNRPYYRPGGVVTRQQMAKFIDNARRLPQLRVDGSTNDPIIYARNSDTDNYADAIVGESTANGRGVMGSSINGVGVLGIATIGYGLSAATFSGDAIHTTSSSGNAGYFAGDVVVTGTCCEAGAGSYTIDNPLDPANKYLYHAAVESADMMNIYNGNVVLDGEGKAVVEMPAWFEAVNRDFRYQLTAVGGPGPNLYVAKKIEGNTFSIAGGSPGLEVSWQVTGIRQDPYANANRVPVEVEKAAGEKGKYLHPEAWGQPEEQGIDYEENKTLLQTLEQSTK